MSESPEVQIARLDERLKSIMTYMEKEEASRATSLQWMGTMSERLANVENALAASAPTINEFTTLKHKMIGAGILGRWVWIGAASIIGWAYGARETLVNFIASGGK